MNHSTPGLPVHHQLPEFTQTHFHWVGDAIQPSHPLSSPSPPALNLSQHQGLFKWVSSSHQVAKVLVSASASVLSMNIQDWFPLRANINTLLLIKIHSYIKIHCIIPSTSFDKCMMTCISHYSIKQNSFTALKSPCAPIHPSFPPPGLWQPLTFLQSP